MGEQHTKWTLFCEPLDYLDGIQSGLIVKAENGAPVAYMFDHSRAVLATAAPDLLEALTEYDRAFTDFDPGNAKSRSRMRMAVIKARAAIAKATGTKDPASEGGRDV